MDARVDQVDDVQRRVPEAVAQESRHVRRVPRAGSGRPRWRRRRDESKEEATATVATAGEARRCWRESGAGSVA